MPLRPSAPGAEQIVVRIEDVDIKNRLVHAFDKTNGRIQVSFRDIVGGGLLRIPAQDEKWLAERQGWVWRLKGRLSSLDEQTRILNDLQPGDTIFSAPGVLYLDVAEVQINNKPIGRITRDVFAKTSDWSAVTLTNTPSNFESIQPFVNGLLIDPTQWSLSGQTLTFVDTFGAGTCVVYYEIVEIAFSDDDTVTSTGIISATETYTP